MKSNDKYSFYDMEADKEDLVEFLDSEQRGESMFVVMAGEDVIGYFYFNRVDRETIDISLEMKPNLTGVGKGVEFLKVGFEEVQTFMQNTNGSCFEFLKMTYYC